jgi:hypothetical protein
LDRALNSKQAFEETPHSNEYPDNTYMQELS